MSGVLAVSAASLAASNNAKRDRDRRNDNVNKDQIIIESKYSINETKRIIAETFNNIFYDEEKQELFNKKDSKYFKFESVIFGGIGTMLIIFVTLFIYQDYNNWDADLSFTYSQYLLIVLISGFTIGYLDNIGYKISKNFVIEKIDNDIMVQIKIFDSYGYRIYDELELEKLIRKLEK